MFNIILLLFLKLLLLDQIFLTIFASVINSITVNLQGWNISTINWINFIYSFLSGTLLNQDVEQLDQRLVHS